MTEQRTITQLTYADVLGYVQPLVLAKFDAPKPAFLPFYSPQLVKSPLPYVILSVGGGAGLTLEGTFDRPFINARVISRSNDFEGGEALALFLDEKLCAFDSSNFLGAVWAGYITRTGGRPQLQMLDDGERYHFTATYITETETGF